MSTINIIAKEGSGKICYVKMLKYDSEKMKNFDDVTSFIMKTLKWPKSVFCDYDVDTKQYIIVSNSISRNGQLDWKIDFRKLNFNEVFRFSENPSITVVAVCYPVSLGLGAGVGEVLTWVEFLKIIFSIAIQLYYYIFPYKLLSKKYGFSRSFIVGTISRCRAWRLGFISTEEFKYKKIIEYSIMRKLGYKKTGDKWVINSMERLKYPFEITREDSVE